MLSARTTMLDSHSTLHTVLYYDTHPATFAEVLRAWQVNSEFRKWFNERLADSPFQAFRWETPAVTAATTDRPFEFVQLDEPTLDRQPDPAAFSEHFRDAVEGVAVFPNLRSDAVLIVPTPQAEPTAYGHLAAFARLAPVEQQHNLWKSVGLAMEQRLGKKPVWLSTAGAGVAWLHVRLDDRPKYYGYVPYRTA